MHKRFINEKKFLEAIIEINKNSRQINVSDEFRDNLEALKEKLKKLREKINNVNIKSVGGIEEAPIDNNYYARKDCKWEKFNGTISDKDPNGDKEPDNENFEFYGPHIGDIVLWAKNEKSESDKYKYYYISPDDLNEFVNNSFDEYIPIGVVVIPSQNRFNTYENNSNKYFIHCIGCSGGNATNKVIEFSDSKRIVYPQANSTKNEIKKWNNITTIENDKYLFPRGPENNYWPLDYDDSGYFQQFNTSYEGYTLSPYKVNNNILSFNELYYSKPEDKTNTSIFEEIDGKQLTYELSVDAGYFDESNNVKNSSSKEYALINSIHNHEIPGTNIEDWYLGSIGEWGFYSARAETIDYAFQKIIDIDGHYRTYSPNLGESWTCSRNRLGNLIMYKDASSFLLVPFDEEDEVSLSVRFIPWIQFDIDTLQEAKLNGDGGNNDEDDNGALTISVDKDIISAGVDYVSPIAYYNGEDVTSECTWTCNYSRSWTYEKKNNRYKFTSLGTTETKEITIKFTCKYKNTTETFEIKREANVFVGNGKINYEGWSTSYGSNTNEDRGIPVFSGDPNQVIIYHFVFVSEEGEYSSGSSGTLVREDLAEGFKPESYSVTPQKDTEIIWSETWMHQGKPWRDGDLDVYLKYMGNSSQTYTFKIKWKNDSGKTIDYEFQYTLPYEED